MIVNQQLQSIITTVGGMKNNIYNTNNSQGLWLNLSNNDV